MISAAAFLKWREPWLRTAKREHLLAFVGWYWRDARIGIVRDGARILAIALARCVHDVAQAREPYFHDETGKIVWIDHIASRHDLGVPLLLLQAQRRFGPRETYAGHVFNRAGELRMLPRKVVERLSQNLQHHGFTLDSGHTAAA